MAQLLDVRAVFRILHDWCTADYDGAEGRRWTAIRTYGLLGPVHHEHALSALLEAIRGQHRPYDLEDDEDDEAYAEYLKEEAIQFADALELLLLALREPVLRALAEHLTDHDRTVRNYALLAFLQACGQPDEANGRPLVLNWYARAAAAVDDTDARHLIAFWQAALADRACTAKALRILRGWVVIADQDAEAEAALTSLLPALVTTPANHSRVSHLLRTVRDADRGRFPAADRLLARISTS
jgi:hypothetical protein